MSYAPASLVLGAVNALDGAHPLSVVTFPALLRKAKRENVDPVAAGVELAGADERQLLEDYFAVPRPPEPDRPFLAPWSKNQIPWQKRKYPDGTLQRRRRDFSGQGLVILQSKTAGPGSDNWRLTPRAGSELMAAGHYTRVRLVDLALWFGRDIDVDSLDPTVFSGAAIPAEALDRLLAWFNYEFSPDVADLVGTVYSDEVPDSYRTVPFAQDPVDADTYEQVGSLPPAPTVSVSRQELVATLEERLRNNGFELPHGMVTRVLTAWLRGDFVILVGQPGTGKTFFATLLARAMEAELDLDPPVTIAVRSDFDETEFLGYERLDGSPELRQFAKEVLTSETPLEAKVVVLEEFNLAAIETYMASVLVATQEPGRRVLLPGGENAHLPIDTFVIATCNSYRDEPETRTRVSSPTKRRSTIITMPNVLADRFDEQPESAVLEQADRIIDNESKKITSRRMGSRPAQFDGLRSNSLDGVGSSRDFSAATRGALNAVCWAILETLPGRSWFTLGLLRDVVLAIVYADRSEEAELDALGQAVADKLIHQLRGSHADVQALREACAQLPNALEIDVLVSRMMDGPSDELLPLI